MKEVKPAIWWYLQLRQATHTTEYDSVSQTPDIYLFITHGYLMMLFVVQTT
jgi:hypothetical protein